MSQQENKLLPGGRDLPALPLPEARGLHDEPLHRRADATAHAAILVKAGEFDIRTLRVEYKLGKCYEAAQELRKAFEKFSRGMTEVTVAFKVLHMDPQFKRIFEKITGRAKYMRRYKRIGEKNEAQQSHAHRRRR